MNNLKEIEKQCKRRNLRKVESLPMLVSPRNPIELDDDDFKMPRRRQSLKGRELAHKFADLAFQHGGHREDVT